jgi:hypothetical protein
MKQFLPLLLLAGCAVDPFPQTLDVTRYDTRTDTITARWVYMTEDECKPTHCEMQVEEFRTVYRIAEGEACSTFRSETE